MALTGNKETDFLVLNQLTDYELTRVGQVNKYVHNLSQDDTFWFNRIMKNYPITSQELKDAKGLLQFSNYRDFYIWIEKQFKSFKHSPSHLTYYFEKFMNNFKYEPYFDKILTVFVKRYQFPKWINIPELLLALKRQFFINFKNDNDITKYQSINSSIHHILMVQPFSFSQKQMAAIFIL